MTCVCYPPRRHYGPRDDGVIPRSPFFFASAAAGGRGELSKNDGAAVISARLCSAGGRAESTADGPAREPVCRHLPSTIRRAGRSSAVAADSWLTSRSCD